MGEWIKKGLINYDPYLAQYLDFNDERIKKGWDSVVLVDGMEGSGKSNLAIACAYYNDPTLTAERIVFTPEQFLSAVDNAKKGQAIVYDEFVTGGLGTDFMSLFQKTIIKKLVMCRKKGLYLYLVIPNIFFLGRYFATHRTTYLIHNYTPDGIKRGEWRVYNYETKKKLYARGKRTDYSYSPSDGAPKWDKRGTYLKTENYPIIDWAEYDRKKEEAIESISLEKKSLKDTARDKALKNAIRFLKEEHRYTNQNISDFLDVSSKSIERWSKKDRQTEVI